MKHHKISVHKILIILFGFLSILNLINCCFFHFSNIYMTENQILYIYSSLAQVIGALLGLTIAGYSVIDSKYNPLVQLMILSQNIQKACVLIVFIRSYT